MCRPRRKRQCSVITSGIWASCPSQSKGVPFSSSMRPATSSLLRANCNGAPIRGSPFHVTSRSSSGFLVLQQTGEMPASGLRLGVSYRFLIHDGVAATLARTDALGLYHQRCGMANALAPCRCSRCHADPAEVPTTALEVTKSCLRNPAAITNTPRHSARQQRYVPASIHSCAKES